MKSLLSFPLFLVAIALAFALTGLQSPYYLLTPGGAYEVEPRLQIPDEYREEMGELAFTAVYAQPASWGELAVAKVTGSGEIVPAEEVRPSGISPEELNRINRRLIDESKQVAAVVGLRAAGFDARVTGQGAEVMGLLEGMPAADVLRPGDVVVAIDGQPVGTATELVEQIRRHRVGEQVRLTIVRDEQRQEVVVGTRGSPTEPGRPLIGASVTTRAFDVQLPFPVEIDTANIGGASAGLIFSLGILDAVTDGLMTRGHDVAGSGTISADGSVGPIGGVAEKVIAAEREGADVFLAPRENYEAARRAARTAQVVAVDRFEDAVRFLCGLEPVEGAAATLPPPCPTGG